MVLNREDYREILRNELSQRIKHNPSYSIRAFARDLSLSPSQVSHILNGRKGLSPKTAVQIGKTLGWSDSEIEYFASLVSSQHARSAALKSAAKKYLHQLNRAGTVIELQNDLFSLISGWHHFAILELLKIKKQVHSVRAISQRLNVNELETGMSLVRLERLGLIVKHPKGWKLQQDSVISSDQVSSDAIRNFHHQILEKAKTAIIAQAANERYYRALMFPVKKKDVPEAQKFLKEFYDEFVKRFMSVDEGDEIYTLALQYFRLTEKEAI